MSKPSISYRLAGRAEKRGAPANVFAFDTGAVAGAEPVRVGVIVG